MSTSNVIHSHGLPSCLNVRLKDVAISEFVDVNKLKKALGKPQLKGSTSKTENNCNISYISIEKKQVM